MESTVQELRKSSISLLSLSTLYAYMYCMMVSNALLKMPVYGGALFMSGRVFVIYFNIFRGTNREYLKKSLRWLGPTLLLVLLTVNLLLMMIFPFQLEDPMIWIMFAIVLGMTMDGTTSSRIIRFYRQGRLHRRQMVLFQASVSLLPALVIYLMLSYSITLITAWQIFGGYLISMALTHYSLWKDQRLPETDHTSDADMESLSASLRHVNAFSTYETMYTIILIGIQVTLVMIYTFIGWTTEEMLTCMILSLVCILGAREFTEFLLRSHYKRRDSDPTYVLLVGLLLWIYGLVIFYRAPQRSLSNVVSYLALGLCTSGTTVCVTCLSGMELDMLRVARFSVGPQLTGYRRMRLAASELAMLVGQMAALVLLTILLVFGGKPDRIDLTEILYRLRPVMAVPALLLALGAVLSVLRFPLSKKHLDKLKRFLNLPSGDANPPLERELQSVVVRRHKKRYGVRFLMLLIRPFYYHKVLGKENIPDVEPGNRIFICNHGELYGPVVANLYVPVVFRPWTISEMMESKEEVAAYTYKYTFSRQAWMPERWKMPISRLAGALSVWLMRSIESIPVYRNKPRELMNTFKLSAEAMQAGDDLLIFPENPDAPALEKPGYVRHGIGDFFTGFAMMGPIYYNKTGKRCVFVPIFADKDSRTITFGKSVTFDPDNNPTEEKLRICDTLRAEMEKISADNEAARQAKHPKKHDRAPSDAC